MSVEGKNYFFLDDLALVFFPDTAFVFDDFRVLHLPVDLLFFVVGDFFLLFFVSFSCPLLFSSSFSCRRWNCFCQDLGGERHMPSSRTKAHMSTISAFEQLSGLL